MEERNSYGYRSFFWPIVLIGIGVIMLMANLDLIPAPSLRLLVRLWPLALVVLGLDILIGRRSPILGALIGLGAIALIVLLLYAAPDIGLEPDFERKTLTFNEPLGSARSAEIAVDLERYATTVGSDVDSVDLFNAVLETYTDADYSAHGDQRKTIDLKPVDSSNFGFDWTVASTRNMRWEIGLSPELPLDLFVDVGSGSASLDLFDLMLTELRVDGGSGSTNLAIPKGDASYPVDVNGGSGSFDIEIEKGAQLDANFDVGSGSFDVIIGAGVTMKLTIDGGSGSIFIDLPEDVSVLLVVEDHGSGGVRVPNDFDLVDDQGDDDRETGVWQSENFGEAKTQIEIRFDPDSGTLTLR